MTPQGMTSAQRTHVLIGPLRLWATLMLLVGLTVAYAYLPHAPIKTEVAVAIGAAKGLLIAALFMQLRRATALVRLAALAGVVWASFLYLFAFADYLTR